MVGRSDLYRLGTVLYELLTCRRRFAGETRAELLEQISTQEPRPPRQIADTIPKELERICVKALAKRASERYTTARDLADDLRHFFECKSRFAKYCRRHHNPCQVRPVNASSVSHQTA